MRAWIEKVRDYTLVALFYGFLIFAPAIIDWLFG